MGMFAAGAAVAAAVGLATKHSPWFRIRASASAKTALIVSAALSGFAVSSEKTITADTRRLNAAKYDCQSSRHDDEYRAIIQQRRAQSSSATAVTTTTTTDALREWVDRHPFRALIFASAPVVGAIAWRQLADRTTPWSVRVLHTRVIGQFSVVVLLLAMMMVTGHGPSSWGSRRDH